MRKVYVDATVRLIVLMDEGVEVDDVVSSMDCTVASELGAQVENTEVLNYEVTDSK